MSGRSQSEVNQKDKFRKQNTYNAGALTMPSNLRISPSSSGIMPRLPGILNEKESELSQSNASTI